MMKIRHNYFRKASHYQNIIGGFSLQNNLRESFTFIYHTYTDLTQRLDVHRGPHSQGRLGSFGTG